MIINHTKTKEQLIEEIESLKTKINSKSLNGTGSVDEFPYKHIIDTSDDLISIASLELKPRFIYTNKSHARKLGYEPDELIGKPCFDFIHPDDRNKLFKILKSYISNKIKKLATGNSLELKEQFEFRILARDNNWRYLDTIAKLINGNKILLLSRDITDRKKNEYALKDSRDSMSFIAQSGMELLQLTTIQSIYDYVAQKIYQLINQKGFVVIVNYNYDANIWTSRSQKGFSPYAEKLGRVLGLDISKISGPIDEKLTDRMKNGRLTNLEPDLSLITNGKISKGSGSIGIKALNIDQMYSIAFKNEHNIFGSLSILSTNKTPELNVKLIEAFIGQASVFIEKRQAQKGLSQSEEKFKLLVENQTDLVVKIDTKGIFQFASPSYCDMFGKSQSELLGSSFMPFIHKADKKKTLYEMEKLYSPPYTCYVEERAMTIHGWRWLAWSDKAILNEYNEVIEIIGVGRDITEQKLAESILKESEEKYRTLFENSSDPTLIIEEDIFVLCNEATVKFLGYNNKDQVIGKTPMELSPEFQPDGQLSTDKALKKINEAKQKGAIRFEWVHIDKNKKELWVNVSLTYLPNINRIYTVWRDINDAKTAELALKASEERYRSVLNNSQEGIFVVQGWHFVYTNPAIYRMLGYDEKELITVDFMNIVHEDDRERIIENNKRRLQGEDIPPYEFRIIKKSQEVAWVYLNATKIDWNGNPAALCFISDITERKKTEIELEKYQEKLEELVMERTKELEEKNKELKKFNKLFIGREFKIKELKDRIKSLES